MGIEVSTRRQLRAYLGASMAFVLVLTVEARPAVGASGKECRVTNTDSGQRYTRLQPAVDAAKPGSHLIVKGICVGKTVIDTRLVIEGVTTTRFASTVSDNSGSDTGGVTNWGTFTMNDTSSIRGNRATTGSVGGVSNIGTLTMTAASSIVGNTAVTSPGGLGNGRSPGPIGTLVAVVCGPGGNVHDNTPDDCYVE
jgi:hypothetical protein